MDTGRTEAIEALLARGDLEGAATAAVERHGPAVFGYLRTLLPEDDAREVYSQWAEDLWKGLPGFRGDGSLRAWLFRVAWHAAARFWRDPYRARGESLPSSIASRLAASMMPSSMLPGGRRDRLQRLREALSPEERTLLGLRIDRELEWAEIAVVLSAEGTAVSAPALRKRFERLKDRLAQLARDDGLLD